VVHPGRRAGRAGLRSSVFGTERSASFDSSFHRCGFGALAFVPLCSCAMSHVSQATEGALRRKPTQQLFGPRFEPCSLGRVPKLLVECRQHDLLADRFLPHQRGRELDRVGAAQTVLPR
jgi:hypothetical protein